MPQVLAFDYLNNLEVVYRDLKPENMVVDAHGNVQLIDLGTLTHRFAFFISEFQLSGSCTLDQGLN